MKKNKSYRNSLADIALLVVAMIWGSGFIASKIALDVGILPFYMMALRFSIAAVLLSIIFYKKFRNINKKIIYSGVIVGLFLFGGFAMQTIGLQYTTPSKNAFLTGVNVVIVPFLYWGISKKRPDIYSIGAVVLCFIGIGLLTLDGNLFLNKGDILTLICAFLFACHIVSVGHFTKGIDPIVLTVIQMITAAILSIICAVLFEQPPKIWSNSAVISVVYLGLFSTLIAFLLQNIAQKYTTSTKTAVILSLESVFGTLLSAVLLKERLTSKMIIGFILIFIAIITSETKLSFLKQKR